MTSIHPICLLSRNGCEICTLYHSFYLLDLCANKEALEVCKKVPRQRSQMDDIEAGLRLFAMTKDKDGSGTCTSELLSNNKNILYF